MITVNAKALLELLEFAAPDHESDEEQLDSKITLIQRTEPFTSTDGEHCAAGVYAYLTEYPEEGLYGPV